MTTIYHNPRCSKSREALHLLEEQGEDFQVVKYLEEPLDKKELRKLISLLKIKPIELVRTQEKIWKENYKDRTLTDDQVLEALAQHPRLMERPVVIKEGRAVIGRPPKKILNLL